MKFDIFYLILKLENSYGCFKFGYISNKKCHFLKILLRHAKKFIKQKIFSQKIIPENTHHKVKYSKLDKSNIFLGHPVDCFYLSICPYYLQTARYLSVARAMVRYVVHDIRTFLNGYQM